MVKTVEQDSLLAADDLILASRNSDQGLQSLHIIARGRWLLVHLYWPLLDLMQGICSILCLMWRMLVWRVLRNRVA
jgi:hypothetical protein